ncbi:MAG: helix-turn-helix domain-containing protein [Minwuia sp.]|nr:MULTISPECIES: helix-turn-helix domain-containing protein [unclassified Minwuia]MDF1732465.1 helix-turn-helix domain-containing protein [Minwuia sp.]
MSLGPVRGSTTGRPIMVLFDILGQRWSLRILWELRQGPLTFRALRDACDGASPTVLNTRLKALRQLGLVDLGPDGYLRTADGDDLGKQLADLDRWANAWAERSAPERPQQS